MTIKVYDGSTWQPQKSLKIYDGTTWNASKKGWIYNGSAWSQFYPEYPQNTAAPSVSGTATQGNTLSCTTGTWTSTDAYNPISYSYQWTRASSDISGATSSTYTTVVADVGNAIGCKVTATNNRGTTTVSSSNTITVTSALPSAPTNLTLTNNTPTPGVFTVSSSSTSATPTISMLANSNITSTTGQINWSSSNQSSWSSNGTFSGSGTTETSVYKSSLTANTNYTGTVTVTGPGSTTATGSWTQPTNVSYYSYSINTGTLSSNEASRTFTLSGGTPGGFYQIYVAAWNTSGVVGISWTAGANATSYDIYINGSLWQQGFVGTSTTYNWGTTGNISVNVRSRNSSGVEATGASSSTTINQTTRQPFTSGNFASAQSASGNYNITTSPPPAVAPSTPTNGGGTYQLPSSGNNFNYITNATFTSSSSGTTPITYNWTVYSSDFSTGPWAFRNSGSIQSSSLSTTLNIPQQGWDSDSFGSWAQYNVTASNSAGSSGTLTWVI